MASRLPRDLPSASKKQGVVLQPHSLTSASRASYNRRVHQGRLVARCKQPRFHSTACQRKRLFSRRRSYLCPGYPRLAASSYPELLPDTPYSGHGGEKKTQKAVERLFFWVGLGSASRDSFQTCATCLRNQARQDKPAGGLRSFDPKQPVGKHFIRLGNGPFPKLPKGSIVAVFVDQLTKLAHFVPTRKTVTAEQFARLYVEQVDGPPWAKRQVHLRWDPVSQVSFGRNSLA